MLGGSGVRTTGRSRPSGVNTKRDCSRLGHCLTQAASDAQPVFDDLLDGQVHRVIIASIGSWTTAIAGHDPSTATWRMGSEVPGTSDCCGGSPWALTGHDDLCSVRS